MKNIIKTLVVVMVLVLALTVLVACDQPQQPTEPEGCKHDCVQEYLPGYDATCTEDGLRPGFKCPDCGEFTKEQAVVPAGHIMTDATCAGPATCVREGCDYTEEALAHTFTVEVEAKAPTCTVAGYEAHIACEVCGAPDETTYVEIPATEEHDFDENDLFYYPSAPTCTGGAYIAGECTVCGNSYILDEVAALDHKDEDKNYVCDVCEEYLCTEHTPAEPVKENEVAATCTAGGSYESVVKCSNCGKEISRETVTTEELGHTEEVVLGKAATCTETGLTDGKKCSVCGEILEEQQFIDYLKHIQGEWITTTYPSCDKEGERLAQCTVCGSIVGQESIPAGHNLVDGICTVCGVVPNVFASKAFVPSSDAAANIYSAAFGYSTLTDGIIFEEGKGRFSSKMNGGKVEGVIDLGAVYDLDELKVYLYWDGGIQKLGTGFTIQVLFGGEWTTVVDCKTVEELQEYWVDNPDNIDKEWLIFDLGGVAARQVKFTIPGQNANGWTTLYEIECSAKVSDKVEPEPEEPVFIENVFAGKTFIPTDAAKASSLAASWWKGSGYEGLTDGIKNADNAPGRFSTVMAATGMMDATIDLGGAYELHSLKLYTYDPAAGTGAGSLGANLLIQVYVNGEWEDVVTCADNATLASYLVVNEGIYNDYLEFDLGGIVAEKVRLYISASASSSGTTYEEIECNGYAK